MHKFLKGKSTLNHIALKADSALLSMGLKFIEYSSPDHTTTDDVTAGVYPFSADEDVTDQGVATSVLCQIFFLIS